MDPFDITRAYQENIGSKPLRDIPFMAASAGLGTYLLSKPALTALSNLAGSFGGPAVQTAVSNYIAPGGDIETGRRRLAMLAAAAGALYGLYKHSDWKGGLKGIKESLTTDDYWAKNPDAAAKYKQPAITQTAEEAAVDMTKTASAWGLEDGFTSSFDTPSIHVGQALNSLHQDPFLLPTYKTKVGGLIADSAIGTKTSQASMVNTAIKSGVDFGTAYLFGTGVGKLLAMPDPLVKRVAMAGGLSAAVVGSGILKQL